MMVEQGRSPPAPERWPGSLVSQPPPPTTACRRSRVRPFRGSPRRESCCASPARRVPRADPGALLHVSRGRRKVRITQAPERQAPLPQVWMPIRGQGIAQRDCGRDSSGPGVSRQNGTRTSRCSSPSRCPLRGQNRPFLVYLSASMYGDDNCRPHSFRLQEIYLLKNQENG